MAQSRAARLSLTLLAALAVVWLATVAVPSRPPAGTSPGASDGAATRTGAVDDDDDGNDGDASSISGPHIAWRGRAAWQIGRASGSGAITEAYTSRPSYLPGETLRVAVSTTAKTFNLTIWRLGATATLMSTSKPISGGRQAAPVVDASTGLVRAAWRNRYSVRIPATWPSGIYLVRVHGIGGADGFATFVVRSTKPSDLLFVVNTLTDAAYNSWGGASLYRLTVPGVKLPVNHAVAVSLDRPNNVADGAGTTFSQQWPLARWLEASGYDVTYTTDWDLSRDPEATPLPRAAIFAGHAEYWSIDMRDWFDRHVVDEPDMGVALFGANSGYWPVTISPDGRTITCYKEALTSPDYLAPSPSSGAGDADGPVPAARADPTLAPNRSLRFRDGNFAASPESRRPEQALFGVQYGSIAVGISDFVLSPSLPQVLREGTDLLAGQSIGGLVGGETDALDPSAPLPANQSLVATAQFRDSYGSPASAAAVYRPLPGDRAVFAAGTFFWMWGLDPAYAAAHGVPAGFVTLTRNILAGVTGAPPPAPNPTPAPAGPSPVSPSASAPAG